MIKKKKTDKLKCNTCIDDDVDKKDIVCRICYMKLYRQRKALQTKIDNLLKALRDMRCED